MPVEGAPRVDLENKRLINAESDLNQLRPIKYNWAIDAYKEGCANNWTPEEIGMGEDIAQWSDPKALTEAERQVITRSLGFFATADSLVANNLVLAIYRSITNPECRQYLLRQVFEEALHTMSYTYIIQSLGLPEAETFNAYHEVPTVAAKARWALEHTAALADPDFRTGTTETDRLLLENLIAFYLVIEGIHFYAGFAQIFALSNRGKMLRTAEQFQYIARDEALHFQTGTRMILQIIRENPHLWTEGMKSRVSDMLRTGTDLEIDYARYVLPEGDPTLNRRNMIDYLRFTANERAETLGLPEVARAPSRNPLPWLSEQLFLRKSKNFFEQRVIDYKSGGQLRWDR